MSRSRSHHLRACVASWATCMWLVVCPALADDTVADADALRRAALAFDDGSDAYRAGKFELAASHFEAADEAVPSARALRMAIRSRHEAKQGARAATLAALALDRYPDDAETKNLALTTISAQEDHLHRLDITCSAPCVLAVGKRAIVGEPRERWTLFVEPGEVTVAASFGKQGSGGEDEQVIAARAGATNKLRFQPRAAGGAAAPSPKPGPRAADPEPALPPDAPSDDGPSWIASPVVFVVLGVATAGLGGVTIWSGIDTLNDPGTDAVREQCRGQGTGCPAYQDGVAKQTRTNVLIGATGGAALLSLVFAIFITDWGGDESSDDAVSLSVQPDGVSLSGRFW